MVCGTLISYNPVSMLDGQIFDKLVRSACLPGTPKTIDIYLTHRNILREKCGKIRGPLVGYRLVNCSPLFAHSRLF